MTCEFFDGDCDECPEQLCPEQVEEVKNSYWKMQEKINSWKKELEDIEKVFYKFKEKYAYYLYEETLREGD